MNEKTETKNKETKKKSIILVGVLSFFRYTDSRVERNSEKKWRITLKCDKVPTAEIMEACKFDPNGAFTPNWLKDNNEGYVNLKTKYDIPIKDIKGNDLDMEDVFEGAKVKVSLTCKDGAVYPKAMRVIENGRPENPFEDM